MPTVSPRSAAARVPSYRARCTLLCAALTAAALSASCASGADLGTGVIPGDSTINGGGNSGGGGGGGGGTVVPSQPIDALGQSVVDEVNKERLKAGVDTVVVDEKLVAAAQLQADQIVQTGTYAHTISGAKYPTLESRVDATGFAWSAVTENLAQGQTTAKAVVAMWAGASTERAKMLDTTYKRVGVAEAWTTGGVQYTVQVLARPK